MKGCGIVIKTFFFIFIILCIFSINMIISPCIQEESFKEDICVFPVFIGLVILITIIINLFITKFVK